MKNELNNWDAAMQALSPELRLKVKRKFKSLFFKEGMEEEYAISTAISLVMQKLKTPAKVAH